MKKTENTFYTCPYCDKEYTDPVDLAHCILSCEERERKKKEEERKRKLIEEEEARYTEIKKAIDNVDNMIDDYIKDYGKFNFKSDRNNRHSLSYVLDNLFF